MHAAPRHPLLAAEDEEPANAPIAAVLDPLAESVRTSNAIFSMVALMPMHVNGAYRAHPLPLLARPVRTPSTK